MFASISARHPASAPLHEAESGRRRVQRCSHLAVDMADADPVMLDCAGRHDLDAVNHPPLAIRCTSLLDTTCADHAACVVTVDAVDRVPQYGVGRHTVFPLACDPRRRDVVHVV